ncbi:MAG: NFACT RNA binding domain-containing protein [Longimicrobiales bacterium]
MSIRWDPVLVRHLARELNGVLAGARVRALRLDGETRDLALLLEDRTLTWALHPTQGWPRLVAPTDPVESDFKLKTRVVGVESPDDERIVRFVLSPAQGRPLVLLVELLGNQWNALLVEGDDSSSGLASAPASDTAGVIRHVLVRRDGARVQRVGEPYRAPEPMTRAGLRGEVDEAAWTAALVAVPEEARAKTLVQRFAWTSSLNAPALLGTGYERWRTITDPDTPSEPVLLDLPTGPQPYPFPLAGVPSRRVESLLAAFEACAATADPTSAPGVGVFDPALLEQLDGALKRADGRVGRMETELAELPEPAALRALGDLILARYAEIPHGSTRAPLVGFDGQAVEVDLDPALAPHANAAAYYQRATKAERAAAQLPALLEQARAARDRVADLVTRARTGTATEAEIAAVLSRGSPRAETPREARPALPYRVFRSSGGLEIRVGRGAHHNDDLTFHHSSPGDVWLHARHVGGAHVILRWPGPGNPPARDLAEAATLAALHSKARTSGSVPVDWTFRKYVRKPRKSPPGRVTVERVETLFVRPDEGLLRALEAGSGEG